MDGPSPRLRGKRGTSPPASPRPGSIPAPAGETYTIPLSAFETQVHPRACGGNGWSWCRTSIVPGPSPRLRGKPQRAPPEDQPSGSIPAPAGETSAGSSRGSTIWVHPRACGGNCRRSLANRQVAGPSPRLRGKLGSAPTSGIVLWSIPAPAGETVRRWHDPYQHEVHPRACGGNYRRRYLLSTGRGPSPRLRGKLLQHTQVSPFVRSIPAPAGETVATGALQINRAVHPRACGGNPAARPPPPAGAGPSPRLRGKPHSQRWLSSP